MLGYMAEREEELGMVLYYSTPTCYLSSGSSPLSFLPPACVPPVQDEEVSWPLEQEDFLPYASDAHSYWSGYFTSRPSSKYIIRQAEVLAQVRPTSLSHDCS